MNIIWCRNWLWSIRCGTLNVSMSSFWLWAQHQIFLRVIKNMTRWNTLWPIICLFYPLIKESQDYLPKILMCFLWKALKQSWFRWGYFKKLYIFSVDSILCNWFGCSKIYSFFLNIVVFFMFSSKKHYSRGNLSFPLIISKLTSLFNHSLFRWEYL